MPVANIQNYSKPGPLPNMPPCPGCSEPLTHVTGYFQHHTNPEAFHENALITPDPYYREPIMLWRNEGTLVHTDFGWLDQTKCPKCGQELTRWDAITYQGDGF